MSGEDKKNLQPNKKPGPKTWSCEPWQVMLDAVTPEPPPEIPPSVPEVKVKKPTPKSVSSQLLKLLSSGKGQGSTSEYNPQVELFNLKSKVLGQPGYKPPPEPMTTYTPYATDDEGDDYDDDDDDDKSVWMPETMDKLKDLMMKIHNTVSAKAKSSSWDIKKPKEMEDFYNAIQMVQSVRDMNSTFMHMWENLESIKDETNCLPESHHIRQTLAILFKKVEICFCKLEVVIDQIEMVVLKADEFLDKQEEECKNDAMVDNVVSLYTDLF